MMNLFLLRSEFDVEEKESESLLREMREEIKEIGEDVR